ncbi:MAG TPA: hypothetical protein VNI57_06870, partial [Candidatus Saccharimonadales bacterium]|nr:hypothetical protein [Candidatus Saccharimonadales bacterium]
MSHPASPGRGDLASLRIDRSSPEREGASRRAGRWIVRIAILAAVAAGAFAAWRQWVTPLQIPEVETGIAVARSPSAAAALLTATGYVVAQRKAAVTPRIAGCSPRRS